jgi:hypothetical protein
MRIICQTKSYNIVFNLEQRLKRLYSFVYCYSISRFSSEWEKRSNKHTHLILYSSYSSNKVLQHRFRSRTKTQAIVFTCALLFDLALLFWMRKKKQQTHAFDIVFELFVRQSFTTSFSISNKDSSDRIHMCIVIRSRASLLNEREEATNTRIWFEMMFLSYSSNKVL